MKEKITWTRKILLYFITGVYFLTISTVGFLHQHDFYNHSGEKDIIQKVVHPVNDGCMACHFIAGHEWTGGSAGEFILLQIRPMASERVFFRTENEQNLPESLTSRGPPQA